jgi:N-acyl-L-homoserine lactone synthetase
MFYVLQERDYRRSVDLLDGMFRLRKKVFADQLRWNVATHGEWERDKYDDLSPVYIVWGKPHCVFGSIRLLPTTGPTLLHDVFFETFPDAAALSAPGIWEATRCCVDIDRVRQHFPEITQTHAFGLMCLAAAELCIRHGIDTLVSNYEPVMRRVYSQVGLDITELGKAEGYGRRPVCCGVFAISDSLIAGMRHALAVRGPLGWTTIEPAKPASAAA